MGMLLRRHYNGAVEQAASGECIKETPSIVSEAEVIAEGEKIPETKVVTSKATNKTKSK